MSNIHHSFVLNYIDSKIQIPAVFLFYRKQATDLLLFVCIFCLPGFSRILARNVYVSRKLAEIFN